MNSAAVVAVHAQQRERQARLQVANLRQRAVLAAVFEGAQRGPVGADVHAVEHPEVVVIEATAAQGHRVEFHPTGALLGPLAADRDALAQETPGAGAGEPAAGHPQGDEQPVQGAGTGSQERLAPIAVQAAMIGFVSGQPFGQEGVQAQTTGLEGGKPDRLQDGQQRLGVIGLGPAQEQTGGARGRRSGAQSADGRLAVVAQKGDRLVEELTFVVRAGSGVRTPQLGQHFVFGLLTHVGVHLG